MTRHKFNDISLLQGEWRLRRILVLVLGLLLLLLPWCITAIDTQEICRLSVMITRWSVLGDVRVMLRLLLLIVIIWRMPRGTRRLSVVFMVCSLVVVLVLVVIVIRTILLRWRSL